MYRFLSSLQLESKIPLRYYTHTTVSNQLWHANLSSPVTKSSGKTRVWDVYHNHLIQESETVVFTALSLGGWTQEYNLNPNIDDHFLASSIQL